MILKKFFMMMMLVLMLSTITFAQVSSMVQEKIQLETGEMVQVREQIQNVQGLKLALNLVENEVARDRLQLNIERLKNLTGEVEVAEGVQSTRVEAKKKGKLLGLIPITVTNRYDIQEDGSLERVQTLLGLLAPDTIVRLNQ